MTLYSKADLRNDALVDLNVLDPTESASAGTIAQVDPKIQKLLEYLNDENCLIFDPSAGLNDDVIPGRVMLAMTELAALKLQASYGLGRPTEQEWLAAMGRLRRSIMEGSNSVPTVVDFF